MRKPNFKPNSRQVCRTVIIRAPFTGRNSVYLVRANCGRTTTMRADYLAKAKCKCATHHS